MAAGADATIHIELPAHTRYPSRIISRCEKRLLAFMERDAYAPYDHAHAQDPPADDRLESRHRIAINDAMRARSSTKAWEPFLDRPLSQLAVVPRDLCLIRGSEAEVSGAIAQVADLVAQIGWVRGITDMAASKMLYLLRPRFVAISDSYVRSALGLPENEAPGPSPWRTEFVRDRFTRVLRAMRELGQVNEAALARLEVYVNWLGTVLISEDCRESTRRWRGKRIPAQLTPVTILDILLWTEGAVNGPMADWRWQKWMADA